MRSVPVSCTALRLRMSPRASSTSHPEIPSLHYMPQLDSLRAAAVTVVMLWHFTSRDTPAREFAVNSGVRLFFVLSGFLITSLLLNARDRRRTGLTAGAAATNFYIRRALRIFPVYYGTLIVAAALGVKAVTESFWWFATYLADIRLAATGATTSVSHLWSLAVEEQFYLVWPWVVLTASTRQLRRVCVIVIVAAPLFRMLTVLVGYPRFGDLLMFGQLDALGA